MIRNTLFPMMLAACLLPGGASRAAPGQSKAVRQLEVELLALRPHGFEPAELRRPAGPFLLHVKNRTGLEEILLELHGFENGIRRARLAEQQTRRGLFAWTPLLDLPPGEYTLSERNHPEWVFRLVIAAGQR